MTANATPATTPTPLVAVIAANVDGFKASANTLIDNSTNALVEAGQHVTRLDEIMRSNTILLPSIVNMLQALPGVGQLEGEISWHTTERFEAVRTPVAVTPPPAAAAGETKFRKIRPRTPLSKARSLVWDYLKLRDTAPATIDTIAEAVNLGPSTVAKMLRSMLDKVLVTRDGHTVLYAVKPMFRSKPRGQKKVHVQQP